MTNSRINAVISTIGEIYQFEEISPSSLVEMTRILNLSLLA